MVMKDGSGTQPGNGAADVQVRPMVKEQASFVGRLICEAFEAKTLHSVGEKYFQNVIRGFGEALELMDQEYWRILVATSNNKPAGVIHLRYHDSKEPPGFGTAVARYLSWWVTLRAGFAGYVTAYTCKKNECYIDHICCDANFRGQGIGKRLMEAAEKQARERGCTTMSLDVAYNNRARHLYERQGFVVVKSRNNYWWLLAVGIGKFDKMEKQL